MVLSLPESTTSASPAVTVPITLNKLRHCKMSDVLSKLPHSWPFAHSILYTTLTPGSGHPALQSGCLRCCSTKPPLGVADEWCATGGAPRRLPSSCPGLHLGQGSACMGKVLHNKSMTYNKMVKITYSEGRQHDIICGWGCLSRYIPLPLSVQDKESRLTANHNKK